MNTRDRSILQQKAHGTYNRNQQIKLLHDMGENCVQIGKMFRLTRQAVRKIILQEG